MAIALVDVNNFYASCERLFRPELRGRPIVVLSNNDGCVVSRSPEAKAMGIKMAGPYFKIREQFEAHGGVAFSSNYALYGDMSGRVMSTLETMAPELEVYSIDEAFLSLSESFAGDLTSLWTTDPAASVAVDRPNGRGWDWPHQDPRQAGQLCSQEVACHWRRRGLA